jgi:hypothetical protein
VLQQVAALIVDEGKWLTLAMTIAGVAVARLLLRHRHSASATTRITGALNLAAGMIIAVMAFGHLLAVATKLATGTLRDGSLLSFFGIGIVLLLPSIMVTRQTAAVLAGRDEDRAKTVACNAWLALTLLALGLHNLPLAAPALFAIAYRLHPAGLLGWTIVGAAAVFNVALFAASLVFLASGQSFEQFRGLQ